MTTIIENGKRYRLSEYITTKGEIKQYKIELKPYSQREHKPKCFKCKEPFSKTYIRSSVDRIQIGWYCRTCERFYYLKEIEKTEI